MDDARDDDVTYCVLLSEIKVMQRRHRPSLPRHLGHGVHQPATVRHLEYNNTIYSNLEYII